MCASVMGLKKNCDVGVGRNRPIAVLECLLSQ